MRKRSRIHPTTHKSIGDLKRETVRGGVVAVCAQVTKLVLQMATTMVLARLLTTEDFGLQGMIATLMGFVGLFKEAGLAAATVQRLEVTEEQIATLFWINVAVGGVLATVTAGLAPLVVAFYGEPRLYWITVVSGVAFAFGGLAAQHQALLAREMRFVLLAKIELVSLATSSAVGVSMAWLGWHYWALVAMGLAASTISAAGVWLAMPWFPGLPRRKCGIRSMLQFGWIGTCNNVIVFLAWNCDNILLGRFWGADVLGVYGRAFQLATLPVNQLNNAIGGVAFSVLSRIQNDTDRLSKSFLRGYSVILSLTIPIIISYPIFDTEIVLVVLGDKWMNVAPILALLAPTALVFALANPLSLLVMSTGRVMRELIISAVTTPLVILGIVLGINHGPKGVALGYSLAMTLLLIPIAAWSKRGTRVTWADLWQTMRRPLLSGAVAGACGLVVKFTLHGVLASVPYLVIGLGFVFGVYAWVLLIGMGQKSFYIELFTEALGRRRG
jgi:PST family polysaccharide transporter